MDWALNCICCLDLFAGLIPEQVHCVRGVVPEQVIRPRARLSKRVDVGSSEEEGLDIHVLYLQITLADLVMNPLVRWIEPAGVADHCH
ncbi:hypothetical protein GALL_544760 [mine drainage metagenome]|uniref:Uncharacterized protein n=1 Tax=mine drainage metagenome TaxID=410659 RepID=A0A1J5PFE4_9ZZZZ